MFKQNFTFSGQTFIFLPLGIFQFALYHILVCMKFYKNEFNRTMWWEQFSSWNRAFTIWYEQVHLSGNTDIFFNWNFSKVNFFQAFKEKLISFALRVQITVYTLVYPLYIKRKWYTGIPWLCFRLVHI